MHLSRINCDVPSHNMDVILGIILINFKSNKNRMEEFVSAPLDSCTGFIYSQEHIRQQMVH